MIKKILVFLLLILFAIGGIYHKTLIRLYQGFKENRISKKYAEFYRIKNEMQVQDITQQLILDASIPNDLKKPLIDGERRIIIFKYPSDGNNVAGYMSYIPYGQHPVLIFLRGGNGFFGVMRPNNRFSFLKGYNVVGTLYRGNIYGGKDEFGGEDVNDVENLIRFFPRLASFTHINLKPPFSIMGVSRGAMEMFLSLSRSAYVKEKVNNAISVSGNVDLTITMNKRPEMKYLFISKFKDSQEKQFDEWLAKRNPVNHVNNLSNSLKVLIIYGLSDQRVSMEEQKSLKLALDRAGITSSFVSVSGADHGFDSHFEEFKKIISNFMNEKSSSK